jgi:hypothetical protein
MLNAMRIDPKGTIQGYPLLQARKLLRALNNRLYWDLKTVQAVLSVGPAKAREIVEALEANGLSKTRREKGSKTWTKTQAAQTFASATAAKSITRQTAERALADFLTRVDRLALVTCWRLLNFAKDERAYTASKRFLLPETGLSPFFYW